MTDAWENTNKQVTILVVEDSLTQLEALRFLLEESGFSVVTASNGEEGITAARENEIDLVISDIVMPSMDGYELCKAMRADDALRHLPVILLTSLADPKDVVQGLESGANNFICKPYDDRALIARVQNVLANVELRKNMSSEMGINIFFAGQRFFITADRLQILDLLLSTYENAVNHNNELVRARDELRLLNEKLEARVAQRTADLAERVKEVRCLYAISSLVAQPRETIDESLKAAVDMIPPGWQYPMDTCARITFGDGVYSSADFRDTPWKQSADIVISGEIAGRVEVCYLEEKPSRDEGPFLKEERDLIIDIARQLGVMISRMQAERELLESKRLVDSVVENVPLMVFLKEAQDLKFVMFNRAGEDLLGHERKDLLGKNDLDLFPPEQAKTFMDYDRRVLAKGEMLDILEEPILTRQKGLRLLHTKKVCIRDPGGAVKYLLGISEDITERRRAETEREKLENQLAQANRLESIGRLAGGVAHDFNNLITVINVHAAFAAEGLQRRDPRLADIETIKEAGDRASKLTRQLLAFSRKQVLKPEVININELVGELEKMVRRLIGEDIEFMTQLEDNLGLVRADPAQIEQVLMNLMINARDAMPTGGKLTIETVNVELDDEYARTHTDSQAGSHVMLAVSDTGIGMTADVREQIFEPFFTTKEKGQGTGLGLATVYGIVKQSGGNIWVYSEPGQGTTFKVYLPRVDDSQTLRPIDPSPKSLSGTETILVVEDEKAVREATRRILASAGYTVLTSANGKEALMACQERGRDIDLVLTDVVMPSMSGKELADRLRETCPELKVIYMSGYTENSIVHHGVLDMNTDFIAKPFNSLDLLSCVRVVLDREKARWN